MSEVNEETLRAREALAGHYKEVLGLLGEDAGREGLLKTPERVAKAMQLTMDSDLNYSLHGISGAMLPDSSGGTVNNYYNTDNRKTVNQTNQSPKALSRLEIYRLTRNALNV